MPCIYALKLRCMCTYILVMDRGYLPPEICRIVLVSSYMTYCINFCLDRWQCGVKVEMLSAVGCPPIPFPSHTIAAVTAIMTLSLYQ